MNISFKGIGDQYVTFAAAETAELAADGEGGVKVPEKGGQTYLVISVDTETQTVGLFL